MAEPSNLVAKNASPSDHLFKIKPLSLTKNASIQKFCSNEFQTGQYKWKLWIHLPGKNNSHGKDCISIFRKLKQWINSTVNKSKDGIDYISIYLELVNPKSLPAGWEATALSRFFVVNHLQDRYFSTKDRLETRYHAMNTIYGIDEFIPVNTFLNPENGYILDDSCTFGVNMDFISEISDEGCIPMISKPEKIYHTWEISNFSSVDGQIVSETFGCDKWEITLSPKRGDSISLFFGTHESDDEDDESDDEYDEGDVGETGLVGKFVLRVKNQLNEKHVEGECNAILHTHLECSSWGWTRFISLKKLKEGFLVKDTLIIEAEVTLIGSCSVQKRISADDDDS